MRHFITLSFVFFSFFSFAQDVKFNQVNLTGLYSNPALTGVNDEQKISAALRNEWYGTNGSIHSTFASYQNGNSRIGNFGAYCLNSYFSNGSYISNRVGLNYAYPIKITKDFTITPGLSAALVQDYVNFNKITFGDIANPRTGELYDIDDPLAIKENNFMVDFSGGLLLTWKNVFAGLSFNQWGNVGGVSIFNTYSNIGVSLRTKNQDLLIIPEVSLNTLAGFYSTAVKVSSQYKWAKFGFEYSTHEYFSSIAGVELGQLALSLGIEWSSSPLSYARPTYEAGLTYKFSKKNSTNLTPYYTYSLF